MHSNRAISTLVCVQAFEVVAFTLLVSLLLKLFYVDIPDIRDYKALAYWVREWGWTLLGVPAAWGGVSVLMRRKIDSGTFFTVSGLVVLASLFIFHCFALLSAGRVPIILKPE